MQHLSYEQRLTSTRDAVNQEQVVPQISQISQKTNRIVPTFKPVKANSVSNVKSISSKFKAIPSSGSQINKSNQKITEKCEYRIKNTQIRPNWPATTQFPDSETPSLQVDALISNIQTVPTTPGNYILIMLYLIK